MSQSSIAKSQPMTSVTKPPILSLAPTLPLANVITTLRLVLLLVVVLITYQLPPVWMYLNIFLLILLFTTDALDGYVARARGEASEFGALYDIAIDRIVELVLLVVFFDLDYVPLWVVLLFIIRGNLVDAIRSNYSASSQKTPFSMTTSRIGAWLVGGKFMRTFYAVIKAVTFCWLALIEALKTGMPEIISTFYLMPVATGLILVSAALCVVRGMPVIFEYLTGDRKE